MSRRHVVPTPDGRWAVRTPGKSPISKHRTQQAAENAAKQAVKTEGGGEVVIHRRNGQIRDSDTVAPGRDPNPHKTPSTDAKGPTMPDEFGDILRELRGDVGIGIKRLAPELGVSYTYLSKLESNRIRPSEELVERVAEYFNYDRNRLLLAAEKIPPEILEILRENPEEAIEFLRERFKGGAVHDPAVRAVVQALTQIPDLDGRFSNLSFLDTGQFSIVFSADDHLTGKRVAIKFLNPFEFDTYRRDCFRREADILSDLNGQRDILNAVAPLAELPLPVSIAGGPVVPFPTPYYGVELGSRSVESVIAAGGWDPELIIRAFGSMCRAVQRINSHGIVHRDLKPGNFIVMPDNTVKLADFGTARRLSDEPLIADYKGWPGATLYTAPEMLALLHDANPEIAIVSDVYSLGSILFELFTGVKLGVVLFDHAFSDELAAVMSRVDKEKRKHSYEQFVPAIVDSHPLPLIGDFGANLPSAISARVERLYRGMAAIDYRSRLCSFLHIFHEIERIQFVLARQKAFARMEELRRRRREGRQARRLAVASRGAYQ